MLVEQRLCYGYHYELYCATTVDQRLWYITAPFQHVWAVLLPPAVGDARAIFGVICERVTTQQEGLADDGKLSNPSQALADFLDKRQVCRCAGWVSPEETIHWESWQGLQKYPEL